MPPQPWALKGDLELGPLSEPNLPHRVSVKMKGRGWVMYTSLSSSGLMVLYIYICGGQYWLLYLSFAKWTASFHIILPVLSGNQRGPFWLCQYQRRWGVMAARNRAFLVVPLHLWNSLSLELRTAPSPETFQWGLKTFLFKMAFDCWYDRLTFSVNLILIILRDPLGFDLLCCFNCFMF